MNIALAFDTETTGLPLFKEPSEHPDQPHIVQLAAVLVDLDTRRELASMDVIVKPERLDEFSDDRVGHPRHHPRACP